MQQPRVALAADVLLSHVTVNNNPGSNGHDTIMPSSPGVVSTGRHRYLITTGKGTNRHAILNAARAERYKHRTTTADLHGASLDTPDDTTYRSGTKSLCDHEAKIINMTVSSKNVLAIASSHSIQLWDLLTGRKLHNIPSILSSGKGSCLLFSSDGILLAATTLVPESLRLTVGVWNCKTGARLSELDIDQESMTQVDNIAFSEDTKLVACSQCEISDRTVAIYETSTGSPTGFEIQFVARFLSLNDNDQRLLCCSMFRIELWDVAMHTFVHLWQLPWTGFEHPIVTPDLRWISVEAKNIMFVVDLESGVETAWTKLSEDVHRLDYSPDTAKVAFIGDNGLIGFWNPRIGLVQQATREDEYRPDGMAVARRGQIVYKDSKHWVRL
jgi:WD40 repeat protein